MTQVNIHEVTSFFNYLNSNPHATFTCAWMKADGSSILPGFGCFYAQISELQSECDKIQGLALATLHTTLNSTDASGKRNSGTIKNVRVLCLDLDRICTEVEIKNFIEKFHASLVVESSPGKHHIYWKVMPTIALDRWSLYQIGLAWHFNGDMNMSNTTSMIRVPGVERFTKQGESWIPRIVHKSDPVPELSDKGVMHLFPSIVNWGELGRDELKKERKQIGQLARKAYKEKGLNKKKALAKVPTAGRNATMYFAVKDESFKQELNEEEAFVFAVELNKAFETPLDLAELRLVSQKAWTKAQIGIEAKAERERKNIEILGGTETKEAIIWEPTTPIVVTDENLNQELSPALDPQSIEHAAVKTNGHSHHKVVDPQTGLNPEGLNFKEQGIDPAIDKRLEEVIPELDNIPESCSHAARKLVDTIWQQNKQANFCDILAASIDAAQFVRLAEYICDQWVEIGVFCKEGLAVHLKGTSRWGSKVYYKTIVGRDMVQSVVMQIIHHAAVKMLRDDVLKVTLKKMPNQHQITTIAATVWSYTMSQAAAPRQASNLIVFQNGVLDLDTQVFTTDLTAGLRYSHPIWCRYRKDVADALLNGLQWNDLCPALAKYMADWFPEDTGVARIILRYMGYCMTTDNNRQKFSFFYGPTRAGKGSLARLICWLVGDPNYCSADYAILDGNFKTSKIHDKLIITLEEVEGSPRDHETRMGYLKKLLGGERVMFERKYQEPFEDQVIGKFILQSNEAPNYQDKGHAVRARMLAVGFERSFEAYNDGKDPALEILRQEADKVGTLCAVSWMLHRTNKNPFEIEGSRALEIGQKELSDNIDIVGSTVKRYLKHANDSELPYSVICDLLDWIADIKEVARPGRVDKQVKQELSVWWPRAAYRPGIYFGNSRCRGYSNIGLNLDELIADFPEFVEQQNTTFCTQHPNLYEYLIPLLVETPVENSQKTALES